MDLPIAALRTLISDAIESADETLSFSRIKSVFYWKPLTINESSLPAVSISPIETQHTVMGTKLTRKIYVIEIVLIFNAKDYVKEVSGDAKKLYAVEAGIEMVEKMNDNHWTTATSIVGVVCANPRLPYTDSEGVERNACDFCFVDNVRYELRRDGAFPTYEIAVRVHANATGDRI